MTIHPYATELYANSLSHWGKPLYVPSWDTYVICRSLPNDCFDVYGTYPLTILKPNVPLAQGLDFLKSKGAISLTLVLDDFHRPDLKSFQGDFSLVNPYKNHFLYTPHAGQNFTPHHRYEIKKATAQLDVQVFSLKDHLNEWLALYENLIAHRELKGVQAFDANHAVCLSDLSGVVAVGAWHHGNLVSAHIWVHHEKRVHSHLAASNARGYELGAAYAVNAFSLNYFQDSTLVNLGGSAGVGEQDGLYRFKKGFSNAHALSHICGAILDQDAYKKLSEKLPESSFFPRYRQLSY